MIDFLDEPHHHKSAQVMADQQEFSNWTWISSGRVVRYAGILYVVYSQTALALIERVDPIAVMDRFGNKDYVAFTPADPAVYGSTYEALDLKNGDRIVIDGRFHTITEGSGQKPKATFDCRFLNRDRFVFAIKKWAERIKKEAESRDSRIMALQSQITRLQDEIRSVETSGNLHLTYGDVLKKSIRREDQAVTQRAAGPQVDKFKDLIEKIRDLSSKKQEGRELTEDELILLKSANSILGTDL